MLDIFGSYCAGYGPALICLNEKLSSEKFATFLEAQQKQGMYTKLPDYLILPVQRIPRYRMLLESLLQNTCPLDPECEVIKKAIDSVAEVADSINQAIREHQDLEELIRIVRQIKNAPPNLVKPKRAFIKEGSLVKICRKSPKPRHFFLFSDCIVYTKRIEAVGTMYMFHRMIMLNSSGGVKRVDDRGSTTNAFSILGKEKSFTLCAKDPAEKEEWIAAIEKAFKNLGASSENGQAPVWVPDKDSDSCMLCGMKFTHFNRRHHCRRCGKVVCGKCSAYRFLLDNVDVVDRVCCPCFDYLVESHGGWSAVQQNPEIYRIPKQQTSGCRVLTQPSLWTQKQVLEWLEQVNKGRFAHLAKAENPPTDGYALLSLSNRDVEILFDNSSLNEDPKRSELVAGFIDQLSKLRIQQRSMIPAENEPAQLSTTKKFANSFRRVIRIGTSGSSSGSSSDPMSPSRSSPSPRPMSPKPTAPSTTAPSTPTPLASSSTPTGSSTQPPTPALPSAPRPSHIHHARSSTGEIITNRPRCKPPTRAPPVVPLDDDD